MLFFQDAVSDVAKWVELMNSEVDNFREVKGDRFEVFQKVDSIEVKPGLECNGQI